MKIAHFAAFAPHGSGQYETVRDLIKAERQIGLEAEFIDYGFKGSNHSRINLKDDHIKTVHPDYAKEADVLFRHSAIPKSIEKALQKPIVLFMHGRPESTFLIGLQEGKQIVKTIFVETTNSLYKGFVTFWQEYLYYWNAMIPTDKIYYIPAPVDLDRYNPDGKKHEFRKFGNPNVMIADLWRKDESPFNIIFAVKRFKERFCPDTKLHIYGLPKGGDNRTFLAKMMNNGSDIFGDFTGPIAGLDKVYRSADMLVTPHMIATRTVREALASGLPIVAGLGNRYTPFTGNSKNIDNFSEAIIKAWHHCNNNNWKIEARKKAEKEFNLKQTGEAIKNLLEEKIL